MAAEAVVSMALEILRDLLSEEARLLSGVKGEVGALETQLREMRCLLEDADKQRHHSKTVDNWISDIKDLTYRAEDAIETYAIKISSRKSSRELKRLLRRFACVLNDCFSLHQIGTEISEINSKLTRVTTSMQEYGIMRSVVKGESSTSASDVNQQWRRRTFPFEIIEDCFLGKENELENLVSLTLDGGQSRVISIWGMGGIGKTTIARKVYNHVKVRHSFESFAWVCITQQCQIRSVLEDVLKQLNPKNRAGVPNLSNTELIGELLEIQKAKKCMVVLDDLWEIDHWDGLKHGFRSKSKILLTTRKLNVAKMGVPFELGFLNIDDGWELLKNKASPNSIIPEFAFEEKLFEKIGKEMVHKCGYLPLAISLLGGLLSSKKSRKEWELVNENINAYLYKVGDIEKEKEMHGILNLSYEDLPYYLKPCFLFMAQFKEDENLVAADVYRMWIAHGMISHDNQGGNEKTLMDTAELYLGELASRSIVQVEVLEDVIPRVKYGSVGLHDVVRELCLSIGKKEDFRLQILEYQGGKFSTLLSESLSSIKTRHLVIHFGRQPDLEGDDEITIIRNEDTSKQVRSLKLINDVNGGITEFPHVVVDFQKFKLLRFVVFFGLNFAGRKSLRGISSLIHLRYLCFEECVLDELPSSISNLRYLDTLDLTNSRNIRVPNVLRKMFRLRHLVFPNYDKEAIGNCRLRLDEGLDELETLFGFNSLAHELKSITKMKNLRNFDATVHDNESLSSIINAIAANWNNLQYCAVEINQGCDFTNSTYLKETLACPNLHELRICVRLGRQLEECENQMITSNIVYLLLYECEIEDDPMELLRKLPFLRELLLNSGSFVGQDMTFHAQGFYRLKFLKLSGLPKMKQWRVEEGAMPSISEIEISNCPFLEMIPEGLKSCATLQTLIIEEMPGLGKRVSEGGEDFDKVRHVPSIIIY